MGPARIKKDRHIKARINPVTANPETRTPSAMIGPPWLPGRNRRKIWTQRHFSRVKAECNVRVSSYYRLKSSEKRRHKTRFVLTLSLTLPLTLCASAQV